MASNPLSIKRAQENNLKAISLEIEHDNLTTVTGLSGSGKSSLAFETVYAEGQRRYIETFSPYTRQFLDKVKKPEVDAIENVRPAIAIRQRTRIHNSRSTVGSLTNVNDYLGALWSNIASATCPECSGEMERWSAAKVAHFIEKEINEDLGSNQVLICSPFTFAPHDLLPELERLKLLGFSRIFLEGTGDIHRIDDLLNGESIDKLVLGEAYIVLSRIKGKKYSPRALNESVGQAYALGSDQAATVIFLGSKVTKRTFFDKVVCPSCGDTGKDLPRPRPHLFSFNHPLGACPDCRGFGNTLAVDLEKVFPDTTLSLRDGAISCWTGPKATSERRELKKYCETEGIAFDVPWRDLSSEQQNKILTTKTRKYWGVLPWFDWLESKKYKMHVRIFLAKYRTQKTCGSCQGLRLKPEALVYKVDGLSIADILRLAIGDLIPWLKEQQETLRQRDQLPRQLADVFSDILSRLTYLDRLGLSYLTLDRQARTLSGGETQRVNLSTALGSGLVSTHFILDEPSVGLHPRDTERLIESVVELAGRGNSVLAVEHDLEFMNASDEIIELGPESGHRGGEVVFQGSQNSWPGIDPSKNRPSDSQKVLPETGIELKISGASARNLKNIEVAIPLQRLVCITGVSGSGKSTLVTEVIKRSWEALQSHQAPDTVEKISGFENLSEVLLVDQAPLAKSPRANIATYTKMWDLLRTMLAESDDALNRNLTKSAFSFNVDAGRCSECKGAGFIKEDMQFLSDVYVPCEVCLGRRFGETVLGVTVRGKNVNDLLNLSISACKELFSDIPKIGEVAALLEKLGLGHLSLGHSLSDLSGGEAQRLKLVPYIQSRSSQGSLLIFDEPTTGLHLYDVYRLIEVFRYLRDEGHSVVCVEHNLSLIQASDWVIDLGPEGGAGGGELLASCTPEELICVPGSQTGEYLKNFLTPLKKRTARSSKVTRAGRENRVAKEIKISGARTHNLRNIDVSVPLGQFVALTGVSGSGKSSIAKDILYAEGQRRYLDCLSPYARQFVKDLPKPDIDSISNILPTICVYQHTFQPSSLSTVGTMSEIYNFLRLLLSKTGRQYCPQHPEQPIGSSSPEEIADLLLGVNERVRLLAPVVKQKKGVHRTVIERALSLELSEIRVDGIVKSPGTFTEGLKKSKVHSIEYVLAHLNPKKVDRDLLVECVGQALILGAGEMILLSSSSEEIFSTSRTCRVCQRGFFRPDPEDLSFNSRRGRCTKCNGKGTVKSSLCPACHGSRISEVGRNIRLGGKNVHELSLLTPPQLLQFLDKINFTPRLQALADPVIREIRAKLATLCQLGLDYIPLSRDCAALSGGELQRLRLATAMGSPLSGVLYIFDEPSSGLHPLENRKVLEKIRSITERGNSVLMIEHDAESILATDSVIDVGPGGGSEGGRIVYAGPTKNLLSSRESPTAHAIASQREEGRRIRKSSDFLSIEGGRANTVKIESLRVPLSQITTVIGVSGSGKSSLVRGIIAESLRSGKKMKDGWSSKVTGASISTSLKVDRIIEIDQKPIGKNARSTPASYLKVFDHLRKLFASTLDAKSRGLGPSYFSYNTGKGRCEACNGLGTIRLEMNFLADARVQCDVCCGDRFNEEAKQIRFSGLSISDVLNLTFGEAKELFSHHRSIHHIMHLTCDLGLGYLTLGQDSSTLSGGESQRLKLVSELSRRGSDHTIYILDEPTTGLHKSDVAKLLDTLSSLVDKGNTVILIEHDEDVIRSSDHLIEMGPGPGEEGGTVIFQGSPTELLRATTPWSRFLKEKDATFTGKVANA